MSAFKLVEYDAVTNEQVRFVYDEIRRELGFGMVPNLFKSMASNPALLQANWLKFRETILYGALPRTLKEMLGIAISQNNGSEYALRVHLHGLSTLGISEEVLTLLVSDFANCPLPERQKAVISFGVQAANSPQTLQEADYDRLRDLGIDDIEIYEIIATANLFLGVNQYTDSIQLEVDSL